jgi:hypothetical protein
MAHRKPNARFPHESAVAASLCRRSPKPLESRAKNRIRSNFLRQSTYGSFMVACRLQLFVPENERDTIFEYSKANDEVASNGIG